MEKDTELIVKLFLKHNPKRIFDDVTKIDVGIMSVLKYLDENSSSRSKDISDNLNVSSARMTVLLKKMEQKELIVKNSLKEDARVTIIDLTNNGRKVIKQLKENMYSNVSLLIDNLGMEKLIDFIEIIKTIETIIKNNHIINEEEK